jgi:hypothetical protein
MGASSSSPGAHVQILLRSLLLIAATTLCLPACDHPSPDSGSAPEPPAASAVPTPRTAPPNPASAAASAAAVPEPDRPKVPMAADGLPASIPLPGSRLPAVRDWKQKGQAIQVDGAEQLGCQARMIREWIRLSCTGNKGELGKPEAAETREQAGAPAYIFARKGESIRLETQLVPGRTYQAELSWHDGKRVFEIRWPRGQARPKLRFVDSGAAKQTDKNDDSDSKHKDKSKH